MAFVGINGFGMMGFSPMQSPFMGGQPSSVFGGASAPMQLMQLTQILQVMLGALQQLASGYQGMMGQQGAPGQVAASQGMGQQLPMFSPGGAAGAAGSAGSGAYGGAGSGSGSGGTGGVGAVGQSDPRFDRWAANPASVGSAERTSISGLNDQQRAALHLWGIQTGSEGRQDGGVYFNVLNNPENFKPEEVNLVRRLYAQEMSTFGGVTGRLLDQEFFGLYQQMTGEDISGRYSNRPVTFARGPVNMDNRLNGQNGLSQFDNAVIRLWGHDRLDNGTNDGSIVDFTLRSNQSMDTDLVQNQRGNLEALLAADEADGGRDGSALARAFVDSMDRIYLGGPGANVDKTLAESGISRVSVGSVLDRIKDTPFPGIPPGIDITNTANIGKCPFFKGGVTGQVSIRN